jgi:hypothetical protein
MTGSSWPAIFLAFFLALALSSCGGSDSDAGDSQATVPDSADGLRLPEDVSGPHDVDRSDEPAVPPEEFPEDFVLTFVYKGIVPGENLDKSDLYIVDSKGRNPMAPNVASPLLLTTFAIDPQACELIMEKKADGTPLTKAPCSCNLGCVVDKALKWIAVTVEKPDQNGFTFQVGQFNEELQVKMVKGARFDNIVDLQFAGGFLYFSQVKVCSDTGCQFIVYRYDLENIPEPKSLFLLPPDEDEDLKNGQAITDGHITASGDGKTVAFISPTIRSSRLYVWEDGKLDELDYICPGGFQGDHCIGTGSEFSDIDPLALTTDGGQIAYFPRTNDGLEYRLYDRKSGTKSSVKLMDTTGQDFAASSCAQIAADGWKFNRVASPIFSANGKYLFFIASSNCDPAKRAFTDILRIQTMLANSATVKASSFYNVTNVPDTDDNSNTVIEAFDLSPEGGNVAYSASPQFGSDKETPLPDHSAKAKQSKELWIADLATTRKMQITYNTKNSVVWLLTLPPLDYTESR